jgi:PTH1 family peptidyl-tRNA hydrolase
MKLIVGLGNPGAQYDQTRHNAGFVVVDEIARRHAMGEVARARFQSATLEARISGEKCLLLKPTTFMNLSGRAVGEAVRFFKLTPSEDMIVVTDDIALPVGTIRLRPGGGSGGHNGLTDIDRALGGEPYARCRVGIGATPKPMKQVDWVLSRFTADEMDDLGRSVVESAEAIECWVSQGIDAAMNTFNKRLPPDANRPGNHPAANTRGDEA